MLFKLFFISTPFEFFSDPINSLGFILNGLYNIVKNLFNKNYWTLINEITKKSFIKEIRKINCPTKLIWGKYDKIVPIKYSSEFLKYINDVELYKVRGSHNWPILNSKKIKKYL
jgi:pimeloyl-ACP methyl ester carboxylesterase